MKKNSSDALLAGVILCRVRLSSLRLNFRAQTCANTRFNAAPLILTMRESLSGKMRPMSKRDAGAISSGAICFRYAPMSALCSSFFFVAASCSLRVAKSRKRDMVRCLFVGLSNAQIIFDLAKDYMLTIIIVADSGRSAAR